MKFAFKNSVLKSEYEFNKKMAGMTNEQSSQIWKKSHTSESKMAFAMPCGYVSSLGEIVEQYEDRYEDHPTLDLTYDTLKHLTLFLCLITELKSWLKKSWKTLKLISNTLLTAN